jgi:outer membrane protein assembly factor BamD
LACTNSPPTLKPLLLAGCMQASNKLIGSMTSNRLLRILAIGLLTAGCASHSQQVQNLTADQLMERGMTALRNRKWSNAVEAFEQFTLQFPTNPRHQEARFRLGEAYIGKKEYITASTELSKLASDYPAGNYADDARFKICEAYHKLSPKSQLDQQYTRAAVDHCQALEAYYPNSDYVAQAKAIATEMINKLADKDFHAAEYYYKRGAIDPAILYYESTIDDFPTSSAAPRSLLRLFQAYSKLGYKEEADAAKARLLKEYPDSDAARTVQALAGPAKPATAIAKDTTNRS